MFIFTLLFYFSWELLSKIGNLSFYFEKTIAGSGVLA